MKDSHQHLNITAAEWQLMRTEFKKTLDKFQVPAREQQELIAIVESTKKEIVIGAAQQQYIPPRKEKSPLTPEEQIIQRYFDAFNRHDIEGVMACFHDDPVITDAEGHRVTGREEVRRAYETSFARFPDGHCELRSCIGNDGRGMAESFFRGTRPREGKVVEAIGAEVLKIRDAKIKEIRDYHRYFPAKAA